jgi:hypothetical protein
VYNKPAEDRELVERNKPSEQIEDTGNPGLETRRCFRNPFYQFSALGESL